MHTGRAFLTAPAGAAAAAFITASLAGATALTHQPGFGHINNLAAGESTDLNCSVNYSCLYATNANTGSDARGLTGWHSGSSGTGPGVAGFTSSTSGNAEGLHGEVLSTGAGGFSAGVRGENSGTGGNGIGVWGSQEGSGWGGYFTTAGAGRGVNASAGDGGTAVYGSAAGGSSLSYGVQGLTGSTAANAAGVQGTINSANAGPGSAGVRGINNGTGGFGVGVWGSQGGSGYGVYGSTPSGTAVIGLHESTTGTNPGVEGDTNSGAAGAVGVLGRVNANPAGAGSIGVRGINSGTGPFGIGVWGSQGGTGYGVYGTSPNGYGVVGDSPSGFAGYFNGKVFVNGTLSKAAGAFTIDHPQDPANKYLSHSFVESPDMKNVYDGVITTGADGFATVRLPSYFQALNRSFRYQLTIVGRSFAQAIVWDEIANNRFTIRTDQPSTKVSWQVTGIRHDAYANAHRIKVVETKEKRGTYLDPQLFGQSRSKSVFKAPPSVNHRAARIPAPSK
jgi:hypothetical protein